MDAKHLASLRQAATALISTAAAPTVLAALQALLADPAFAAVASALPRRPAQPTPGTAVARAPPLPTPRPARAKPTARARSAAAASDPAWEELRGRVKAAMAERGANYADVAAAISHSVTATRIDLTSRKPARQSMQAKLLQWLTNGAAGALEVAAQPIPFRRSSTGAYVDDAFYSASAAD